MEVAQHDRVAEAGQEAERRRAQAAAPGRDRGRRRRRRRGQPDGRVVRGGGRLQGPVPGGHVEGPRVLHGRLHAADQRALVQVRAAQRRVALRARVPVHRHNGVRLFRQLSGDIHVHQVSMCPEKITSVQ